MSVDRARMGVMIGQNDKGGFEGVKGGGGVVVMIKLGMSYLAFCFWEKMERNGEEELGNRRRDEEEEEERSFMAAT